MWRRSRRGGCHGRNFCQTEGGRAGGKGKGEESRGHQEDQEVMAKNSFGTETEGPLWNYLATKASFFNISFTDSCSERLRRCKTIRCYFILIFLSSPALPTIHLPLSLVLACNSEKLQCFLVLNCKKRKYIFCLSPGEFLHSSTNDF